MITLQKSNSISHKRTNSISHKRTKSHGRIILTTSQEPEIKIHNVHTEQKQLIDGLSSFLPPIDYKILSLCLLWYIFSAVSNTTTKSILKQFAYPITLTEVQFSLNCLFCVVLYQGILMSPNLENSFPTGTLPNLRLRDSISKFVTPDDFILSITLPMGIFQFVGHITSHNATSLIPVSMVHTIKALAPLVTVLSYKFLFNKKYNYVTYLTLCPLILGVMLSCFNKTTLGEKSFLKGIFFAIISMIIFVSQNIFAKKFLTIEKASLPTSSVASSSNKKLDKISILFFCSIIGFIFTLPVYLYSETFSNTKFSLLEITSSIFLTMIVNGLSHFGQSLLAFHILGQISPVNYSIANIMKRIVVIICAIICEGQRVSKTQGFGLILTMFGLYCYDRWGIQKNTN